MERLLNNNQINNNHRCNCYNCIRSCHVHYSHASHVYQRRDRCDQDSTNNIRTGLRFASKLFHQLFGIHKVYCRVPKSEIDKMFKEYEDDIKGVKPDTYEETDGWTRVKQMWKGALYESGTEADMITNVFLSKYIN